jgi:hypothetical protein
LGVRLTAGQQSLELSMVVRIHHPQPFLRKFIGYKES